MSNFYEIDELLNEAIMTGVPSVIVEGIDDLSIYSEIAGKIPFDVEVYPIEYIKGYTEGCEQVVNAIKDLNAIGSGRYALESNILGVIDKDVRDFRGEVPDVSPLLVLRYYSIESHFLSLGVIENCLRQLSKTNRELVTEDLCAQVMCEVEEKLHDLYYFSLEALRLAIDSSYDASFSYSFPWGRMKDATIRKTLEERKACLDRFAGELGLEPGVGALKSIAKGKWLLESFSVELFEILNALSNRCGNDVVKNCVACGAGDHEKCLYRLREGVNKNSVRNLALSDVSGDEFDYIIERIASMKPAG